MRTILFILVFISSQSLKAQQPDSVKAFINKALHLMEQHSVFSAGLNWNKIRDTAHALSKHATTFKEAAPGIKHAFNTLSDKHGWLVFGDDVYRNPAFKPDTGRITYNMKQAALKGPKIYTGIVQGKYAYISIPFFGGQSDSLMKLFSQKIQDSLSSVIDKNTKGIIIDLRLNAGGNMFPMFAGVSNVLGEIDFAVYPTAIKDSVEKSSITKNGVAINGKLITPLPKTYGDLTSYPVAVIIGPITGSAGECLAAGFIGREKTVLVGEATAGFTTANDGFILHGEDYGMVLAVGYLRDRNGKIYLENVIPHITVTGGDDFFNRQNDKKIQAAVKWFERNKNK